MWPTGRLVGPAPALDLMVSDDIGPMDLAGFVRTPTVSPWASSDPEEVRQVDAPVVGATGSDLPCRPRCSNQYTGDGAGALLPTPKRSE